MSSIKSATLPVMGGHMAQGDMIMMSRNELQRLHVIKKVLEGVVTQNEASQILLLSDRQVRRIVQRIKGEGEQGVIHRSRGKPSNRKTLQIVREKIITLYRKHYKDFGPTLASEKLLERDHIRIHDETLRLMLIQSGDWVKTRKKKKCRSFRERRGHVGEMVQMDGSHHKWFEDRGPKCVLMGYIDDASNETFARLYDYEGTIPAMDSFRRYIDTYGLPVSIYLDKHSTYKSTARPTIEDELKNTEPASQFERALKELSVRIIHANSPQAKGRVERLFETLQDRLIKEMRLEGIATIEEGNMFLKEYLPLYNRRFAVHPVKEGNLHRPLDKDTDLTMILCRKTERTLKNDRTIQYRAKLYQVEDIIRGKVMVHECLDGSLVVTHKDRRVRFHEIVHRPAPIEEQRDQKPKKSCAPSQDHPWRTFTIRFPKRNRDTEREHEINT
jgi:transposase